MVLRKELWIEQAHFREFKDVDRADDDECRQHNTRRLKEGLLKQDCVHAPAEPFSTEHLIVTRHDHQGPHVQYGQGARPCVKRREIPHRHEHLQMMRQDVGLVRAERNSEQVLCPTCPVRHAEAIDVKRNVPTYDSRRYGQRLPNE